MNRIIFALDTTNLDKAIDIAQKIKNKIFTIKLGLEFFNAHGKEGVKKFNEIGITNLMLDLKLKDIPETVYKAIKALDNIQFGFLTIHGQGGKSMIDKAKKAADEIKSRPKISGTNPSSFHCLQPILSEGNLTLNGMRRQMESSGEFRSLFHSAWRQPMHVARLHQFHCPHSHHAQLLLLLVVVRRSPGAIALRRAAGGGPSGAGAER